MSILYGNNDIKSIKYNKTELDKVIYNGTKVYIKEVYKSYNIFVSSYSKTNNSGEYSSYYVKEDNTTKFIAREETYYNNNIPVLESGNYTIRMYYNPKSNNHLSYNNISVYDNYIFKTLKATKISEPHTWTDYDYSTNPPTQTGYRTVTKYKMDNGWYLYSVSHYPTNVYEISGISFDDGSGRMTGDLKKYVKAGDSIPYLLCEYYNDNVYDDGYMRYTLTF